MLPVAVRGSGLGGAPNIMSDKADPSSNAASSMAKKLTTSALVSQGLMRIVREGGRGRAGRISRVYSSTCAPPQGRRSIASVPAF